MTRKPRSVAAPNLTFDDYFREGEQKSKEEGFAPSTKSAAPPPPPKSAVKSPRPEADTNDGVGENKAAEPEVETEPGPESTNG